MANTSAKSNAGGGSAREQRAGTPSSTHGQLPMDTDIDAQVLADIYPVKDLTSARKHLDERGWILSAKSFSWEKLSKILFAITFDEKSLSKDAKAAIRAVGFLIKDNYEDDLTDTNPRKYPRKLHQQSTPPLRKSKHQQTSLNPHPTLKR